MEARGQGAAGVILARQRATAAVRRARGLAWTLWALATLFSCIAFLFILATFSVDTPSRGFGFRGWVPTVAVLWSTIGARIAARQPRNSVGWLILAVGWLWSVNAMFEEYATFAFYPVELDLPFVQTMVWFNNMVGAVVAGLSAIALLVVPDGRLPSRRWVVIASAAVAVAVASVALEAVWPRRLVPFPFQNPYGLDALRDYEQLRPTVFSMISIAQGLAVLIPTGALLLRLRASTGERRQQLKWVAAAATFTSVAVFLYALTSSVFVQYAQITGLILVPLSFGIAMRRYRLYEIDRILNRTIVFGGATALLAGVYTASVGLMQRVFVALTGERSDAAVVLTTLLVAAAFTPLRARLDQFLKRNFASDLPGTRGLEEFTKEIDEHLRLSDREGLLTSLLSESVSTLGAIGGALEMNDIEATAPVAVGRWTGDVHLGVTVREHGDVVARVLLGPRANGDMYSDTAHRRLERAAAVVGRALDRIPQRVRQ
ncbi:MAG TPA: hypothetical protein VM052_09400 [Candidatus Limnocylindrales bacterium]|nr:hypothetical protein [Candidatus Limnocylindrales bacterium]